MELHEYPYGWLGILFEAVIRHDLICDIHTLTCTDMLTNKILEASGCTGIKDHWGNSDDRALVFEPYGDHEAEAKKLAKYLNVELVAGKPAEWNDRCFRYEFLMREVSNAARAFEELAKAADWEFSRRCKSEDAVKQLTKAIGEELKRT